MEAIQNVGRSIKNLCEKENEHWDISPRVRSGFAAPLWGPPHSVPPLIYAIRSFQPWDTPATPNLSLVTSKAKLLERIAYAWYQHLISHLFFNPLHLPNSLHQVINSSLIPKSMDITLLVLVDFHIIWCYWILPPGYAPLSHSSLSSPPASLPTPFLSSSLGSPLPLPQRPPTLQGRLVQTGSTVLDLTACANISSPWLTALRPLVNDLLPWHLHLLIYKIGTVIVFPGNGYWEN